MADHAQFSPSSLYRVQACPGSPALIAKLPEDERKSPDSPASIQGTLRHALLAERFNRKQTPGYQNVIHFPPPMPEDHRAVDVIWPYVESHPALTGGVGHQAWSEERLEIGRWCGLPAGVLWGTADLVLATPRVLEIADAKFGQRPVAPDSIQLRAYAVGAGALLIHPVTGAFAPEFRQMRNVKLTILQPTAPHPVSSVEFPLDALRTWAGEVKEIVTKAQAPDAPLAPGDHCTFCPAAASCPARNAAAQQAVSSMFDVIGFSGTDPEPDIPEVPPEYQGAPLLEQVSELAHMDPETLSPDQLGRVLDLAPVVEALFKSMRAKAEKLLREGQPVGGWKLIEGRRGREWTIKEQADLVAALRKLGLSAEEIWNKEVRTPAQIDKTVLAKANKRAIAKFGDLWTWKPGKPVLAPESDPTPAWNEPAQMFEPIPEDPTPKTEDPEPPSWL